MISGLNPRRESFVDFRGMQIFNKTCVPFIVCFEIQVWALDSEMHHLLGARKMGSLSVSVPSFHLPHAVPQPW